MFGDEVNGVELEDYLVEVTLKATTEGDFGHTNRNVKINKLRVIEDNNGEDGDLKVYLYANQDSAWFDLVKCVWGDMPDGRGFNLSKDENSTLEAYAFASVPGTYVVTFEAIDIDNNNEVFCSGKVTIIITDEASDNSENDGDNGNGEE